MELRGCILVIVVLSLWGMSAIKASAAEPPRKSPPLERLSLSGTGWGPEIVSTAGFPNSGLAGFRFNFIDEGDHEIERIGVRSFAHGLELEYSPTLPNFKDYEWVVTRLQLPVGTTFHHFVGCDDTAEVKLPDRVLEADEAEGVPVLAGFYIYRGGQDEVHSLKIKIYRGSYVGGANDDVFLDVKLTDRDTSYGSPPFCYKVDYAMVPERKVAAENQCRSTGTTTTDSYEFSNESQYPVLQGFQLAFENEEHDLDEIGVSITPTMGKVWLNDKNDDDLFTWELCYADVREMSELQREPTIVPSQPVSQ